MFHLLILDRINENSPPLNSASSLDAPSTLIQSENTDPNSMNRKDETVHKMQVDITENLLENKIIQSVNETEPCHLHSDQSLEQLHMDDTSTDLPLSTSDDHASITDVVAATETVSSIQVKCEAVAPQYLGECDHSAISLDSDDDCFMVDDELIELGVISDANNEYGSNKILPLVKSKSHDLVNTQPYENRKDTLKSKGAVKDFSGVILNSNEFHQQGDTKNAQKVRNLKVTLMPHQLQALDWMMKREKQSPFGGILADDMGLGKTLTIIALVSASNKSKFVSKELSSGTLVVCPASLINQWQSEVEKYVVRGSLSICVYHGDLQARLKTDLSKFDLVITTYGVVLVDTSKEGPLYKKRWKRIILDEAHLIRNGKTESALSCFKLIGINRWAVSGTPIQNTANDLFSLLKFIQYKPYDKLHIFKDTLVGGLANLTRIVEPVLLRRTKSNLQMSGILPALKAKEVHEILIDCSDEETSAYMRILEFTKTLFYQYLQKYGSQKNNLQNKRQELGIFDDGIKRHHIFVILLRLRQFCNHPSLINTVSV